MHGSGHVVFFLLISARLPRTAPGLSTAYFGEFRDAFQFTPMLGPRIRGDLRI